MREMKDSGIEWIGKIPNTWEIKKIRFVASIIRGGSPRPINQYLSDTDDGYNWIRIGDTTKGDKYIRTTKLKIIRGGLSSTRFVKQNTLLLTNSMSYGEPYILKTNGCIHDGWLAFYNYIGIDKLFLYYSLLSESVRNQFAVSVNGSVVVNLNIEKVKNAYIVLPDLRKQQAIADFLDAKCADIDSLTEDIQKQIETLKEYKKSVITQAVTKGLDPNVEMKDSGIEWIGEIPKHWIVKRIKNIICNDKDGIKIGPFGSALSNKTISNGSYNIYGQANLVNNDFSYTKNTINEKTFYSLKSYQVLPNDICLSMMGTIGKCKIVPTNINPGIMDSHLIKIRLDEVQMLSKFFEYVYDKDLSDVCIIEMQYVKKGSIMDGLNTSIVKNLRLVVPPIAEQRIIADFLDSKCADIDAAIEGKQKQLDVLKEYKKSLIYEYVTGKKEVPCCE